jgi:hypothetical protein
VGGRAVSEERATDESRGACRDVALRNEITAIVYVRGFYDKKTFQNCIAASRYSSFALLY